MLRFNNFATFDKKLDALGVLTNMFVNFTGIPLTIQTPPPSPVPINSRVPQPSPFSVSVEHPLSMQRDPTSATVLPERVWQECVMGGPPVSHHSSTNGVYEFTGQWDFVDPARRANCTCSKWVFCFCLFVGWQLFRFYDTLFFVHIIYS